MDKIKNLIKELVSRNENIYYSSKIDNVKIIYIQDKEIATNNKYYVFVYNYGDDIRKHHLLLSDKTPSQLIEIQNNEFNTGLSEIIKEKHNNYNDDKPLKTQNLLLNSLVNLISKNKPQETILNILSEEKPLFNKLLEIFGIATETISTNEFIFTDLYISNGIKTDGNTTIFLLNNTFDKEYGLLIEDNQNNTLTNKYNLPFKDINNLTENDKLLFTGMVTPYTTDTEKVMNNLISDLNNNIETYTTDNTNDELILNYMSELQEKINEKKYNLKLEENNRQIDLLKTDIIIILENIRGHDENGEPLNPKGLGKADLPKCLAKYLSLKYGLILRSNVNTPHLLNKDNNCYELTNHEYLLSLIANDFGHNNISMTDTKKALDYIDIRLKPNYHIIRFDNCIYDMKTHKVIKLTSPQLPYYDIYFNYNSEAKGELIQEFLYSSLNENQVNGLLELIGYLFTVGNKENIIICFIGKGGGGKSVLSNIISHLFKRVSNLPIHNLNKNHDLMSLENSLLNICNDTDNSTIKDNGTFKQITGGDSIYINPKYREPYVMPPFEVPYFIMVGNQFPKFERLEIPIIERLMIIEFKKGFRGTKKQNKNLYDDIISNDDNMEWLIYNSLQAYRNIDINNKSFTLKKTTEENRDLYNKHTNPLLWIVKKIIVFVDYDNFISEIKDNNLSNYMTSYISVDELKQNILTYANNEGLDIGLTENNNISTQKLTNTIKTAFNLWGLNDSINYDYAPIKKQENNNRFLVYPNIKFKEANKE